MLVRLRNDRYLNTSQIRTIIPAKDWVGKFAVNDGKPLEDDEYIVTYAGIKTTDLALKISKDDLGKIKRAMYIERCNLQPV